LIGECYTIVTHMKISRTSYSSLVLSPKWISDFIFIQLKIPTKYTQL